MKKRMKKLLCALCAALMLCLTPFAALCEGWELTIYADENGKQIKELYDQTGALVAKAYINRTPDGPVYEAREGTLQESRDENGNLQRSYITVDGTPISEQYQEGSLFRIDYDRSGNTAYEEYYDDGIDLHYFTTDGTEGYKYYAADGFLGHESYTYADGTESELNYRENHVLESKFYTDAEGKEVGEYYNDQGKLDEYYVEYTDADGRNVEERYKADHQLWLRTIYKGDALQREERYDVDPEAGYYLMELSIGYQENGVDYMAKEFYHAWMVEEEDGEVRVGTNRHAITVSHEEEGKVIAYHYSIVHMNSSPLCDPNYTVTYPLNKADKKDLKLHFTTVEFTDEAGNITMEFYNPDGKLTERIIWDADYNRISDEYYDEAWKKEQNG